MINKTLLVLISVLFLSIPVCLYSQQPGSAPDSRGTDARPGAPAADASGEDSAAGNNGTAKPEIMDMEDIESPVLEIKAVEGQDKLFSIELRNVELADFFRVVAHDYGINMIVDRNVKGKVTASLRDISIEEALDRIAEMYNLTFEKKGSVTVVKFDFVTKTFILKNIKVEDLLSTDTDQKGENVNTIYDLLSPQGKIFSGKQLNSIVVIDYQRNVKEIEDFIEAVDQKTAVRVFKLKYISVKDLFPDLQETERDQRTKEREERTAERDEIKELKGTTSSQ